MYIRENRLPVTLTIIFSKKKKIYFEENLKNGRISPGALCRLDPRTNHQDRIWFDFFSIVLTFYLPNMFLNPLAVFDPTME